MTKLNFRKIVYITVLLTFAFSLISEQFPDFNFWKYSFVSFSIFLFLFFLHQLYEKYFWEHKWLKKVFILIGFQEYPNVAGLWEMKYFSSYQYDWEKQEYKTEGIGEIIIEKIEGGFYYHGRFDQSKFKSSSNYFECNKNGEWVIGYKYNNDPNEAELKNTGFVSHCGFTMLTFDTHSPNEMVGFYGNDENRKTRGKITLKKK